MINLRGARSGFTVLSGRVALIVSASVTALLLPLIASHQVVGSLLVAQTLIAGGATICQLGLTFSMPSLIAERLAHSDRAGAKILAYEGLHLVLLAGVTTISGIAALLALSGAFHLEAKFHYDGAAVLLIACSVAGAALVAVLAEVHRAREAFTLSAVLPLGSAAATALLALMVWGAAEQTSLIALLSAGLAGLVAFSLIGGAALLIVARSWQGTPEKIYGYRAILQSSWPNVITTVVLFIVAQADLWTVALLGDPVELANYGVGTRLSWLILLPLATVNGLISPFIVKCWARRRKRALQHVLTRTTAGAAFAALIGYVCFLLVGSQAITTVWGESYRPVYQIVAIMGFGQVLHTAGGSAGQLLLLLGHQRFVMRVTLAIGAGTIVLGILAMKVAGIYGLAAVYSLGLVVQTVAFALRAGQKLGLFPGLGQSIAQPAIGSRPS